MKVSSSQIHRTFHRADNDCSDNRCSEKDLEAATGGVL